MINEYQKANILFLHLNDLNSFHKVLPSKIFEYAATGKPILAGVKGYAAKFLREQVKGVEIFEAVSFYILFNRLEIYPTLVVVFDFSKFTDIFKTWLGNRILCI